mgnify:CR=1 FL=1
MLPCSFLFPLLSFILQILGSIKGYWLPQYKGKNERHAWSWYDVFKPTYAAPLQAL